MCAPQREPSVAELIASLKFWESDAADTSEYAFMKKMMIEHIRDSLTKRTAVRGNKLHRMVYGKPHWTPVSNAVWVGYQR